MVHHWNRKNTAKEEVVVEVPFPPRLVNKMLAGPELEDVRVHVHHELGRMSKLKDTADPKEVVEVSRKAVAEIDPRISRTGPRTVLLVEKLPLREDTSYILKGPRSMIDWIYTQCDIGNPIPFVISESTPPRLRLA